MNENLHNKIEKMIILSVKCQTNSSKLTLKSDIGKMQFSDQLAPVSPTVTGTEKLLNLNPNKASGPDKISPRLLKELHHKIAPILTKVFRSSLKFGIVPEDWKTALVAPVYKKA